MTLAHTLVPGSEMKYRVKIKARPNQRVQFPGICVYCAGPAGGHMALRKRIGRITRMIDVPLCLDCRQQLNRQSGEAMQLQKIGRIAAFIAFVIVLSTALALTPAGITLTLRLLISLSLALVTTQAILLLFWRARRKAALPLQKEILASAGIGDFSWRATTFEFSNPTFAERFMRINDAVLMES